MKVGDYIRTKDGVIAKITDIIEDISIDCDRDVFDLNYLAMVEIPYCVKDEYIIKSSPNIIDLIEVGDYVNGYKSTYVVNEEPCPSGKFVDIDCDKDSSNSYFFENDIKTIVTKEQFSQMEYRIGD